MRRQRVSKQHWVPFKFILVSVLTYFPPKTIFNTTTFSKLFYKSIKASKPNAHSLFNSLHKLLSSQFSFHKLFQLTFSDAMGTFQIIYIRKNHQPYHHNITMPLSRKLLPTPTSIIFHTFFCHHFPQHDDTTTNLNYNMHRHLSIYFSILNILITFKQNNYFFKLFYT